MELAWKEKRELKSKPVAGTGSYHAVHASRHLENHFDETGRASTQQCLIKRNNKRTKHEGKFTIKTEQCQEEAASTESKCKRGGGIQ